MTKDSEAQDYWAKRLVAFVIDAVIVLTVLAVITAVIALPFLFSGGLGGFAPLAALFGVFSFVWGFILILYFAFYEANSGASLGKNIFGLKVVSRTGSNPTIAEALVRNISKIYWLLLLLDVIVGLALSKGYQQKYSDQFIGTKVVKKQS